MSDVGPVQWFERLGKYVGLASAIASAFSIKNPVTFFVFLGCAVLLVGHFLVRVALGRIVGTRMSGGRAPARRWQRIAAFCGLLLLIGATGFVTILYWPKPPLEIVGIDVVEHSPGDELDAIIDERLLALAAENGLSAESIAARYAAGDRVIETLLEDSLEHDPPAIRLVSLDLVLRNRGDETAVLKEITLRVHSAVLLESCEEFGVVTVSNVYNAKLCPTHPPNEPPTEVEVHDVVFSVSADSEPERFQIDLANDRACTYLPGLALYELDVVLVFDADERRLESERVVVAVPTSSYALDVGRTGLESVHEFDASDDCHAWNLKQAADFTALWEVDRLSESAGRLRNVARVLMQNEVNSD